MVSSFLTRGFLIGEPAPEALSSLLAETAGDDFSAEAGMSLDRSDVIDARVVVLVVIPVEVFREVSDGLAVVQELARIFRRALDDGEGRLDEGIVVGRARAGKQVRHMMIFTKLADRFCFDLPATVVDQLGPPVFRQVEDVFLFQPGLEQQAGFCGGLVPGNPPSDDFAGKLIEEQVEVKADPLSYPINRCSIVTATGL